jgi:hypothetical protein
MRRLAFADTLQTTSICNNYNHVVQILPLLFYDISRRAGLLIWRKSYCLWRISIWIVEIYGGNYFLHGGEKTAIGDVQKALILRVKEPIGGSRAARVQLRYHVWFKGSLATSNLSVGATRYSIP